MIKLVFHATVRSIQNAGKLQLLFLWQSLVGTIQTTLSVSALVYGRVGVRVSGLPCLARPLTIDRGGATGEPRIATRASQTAFIVVGGSHLPRPVR